VAAIQRAADVASAEMVAAPRIRLSEADATTADVPSGARALQEALAARYATFEIGGEPAAVDKWPGWVRAAFLFGAASASWAILIGGVSLVHG
jgi:hypothetical protein